MFSSGIYQERRQRLRALLKGGVVVLPANLDAPCSCKNNCYGFRQDSSFRYLFGVNLPAYIGVMDLDSAQEWLVGEESTLEDLIWRGEHPPLKELACNSGVEGVMSPAELRRYLSLALSLGRQIHILPQYRGETMLLLADILECTPLELTRYISADLIFAVAELREVKGSEEIAELEDVYKIGYDMHTTAMRLTNEGRTEREVAGVLEGIAMSRGAGVSFPTIYTQRGERLHNTSLDGVLKSGKMVLCDAGAESLSGYASDHTRTYPVSGRFSTQQRDIYNIVLASHCHVAHSARAGMLYRDLHQEAQRRLAEGLLDFGLLRGSADEIIDSGAVRLFMPHGTSHGMGLDVHDCEALGERSFDFEEYKTRARELGISIFRDAWRLREGAVITNEPGLYFIEPLLKSSQAQGLYKDIVNYPLALSMCDFGGVRIEDDLIITHSGAREIGQNRPIPKSVEEIENYMRR